MRRTKLRNTTDIPDEQVREIVRSVRPSGISNFDVMLKNGRHYKGMAYTQGSGYHMNWDWFITVHMQAAEDYPDKQYWMSRPIYRKVIKFPYQWPSHGAYLGCLLLSRQECLAYLLAHELRHLWQRKHKNGKVWGSRGRLSERDADAYAIRMVRRYRHETREENGHELRQMFDTILS